VAVSFIDGGNGKTTNLSQVIDKFITKCSIKYTSSSAGFELQTFKGFEKNSKVYYLLT
jgi:hypothetical protein